jgi:hypothetical protein
MNSAALHIAILRSAAILVPVAQRADWLAEWRSELWHIRRDPQGVNLTAFCMGAFRDAFWLWRDDPSPERFSLSTESPGRCLGWLAATAMACLALGLLLPAARKVLLSTLYPRNLAMLNPAWDGDPSIANGFFAPYASVTREWFESLKAVDGDQFTGLAFYVPASLPVDTPSGKRTLFVAKTTPELFRLLNIPVPERQAGTPMLVLNSRAWQKYFNGDRRGVAGVIPDDLWRLPAGVDGWLIGDDSALAALPANTEGFVLGRLRYGSPRNSRFHYIRLTDRAFVLLWPVIPMFVFSCALFMVMTFSSSGGNMRTRGATGLRAALFLAAKTLLVLPAIAFGSLDLASFGGLVAPLYLDLTMFGSFLAARWIIADQRNRCPVCLRLLARPVRIGESSRILLEWHGTELMCDRGHGLLYVPEWPAIWSGRNRWLDLGASWSGLFH